MTSRITLTAKVLFEETCSYFNVVNLVGVTIKVMISGVGGSSSAGRALAFQAGGREFESRLPLQTS